MTPRLKLLFSSPCLGWGLALFPTLPCERPGQQHGLFLCPVLAAGPVQPSLIPLPSLGPLPIPHTGKHLLQWKMSALHSSPVLCPCSALLEHPAAFPPRTAPDWGFLYTAFAYPELKIVPNFVNTLCSWGCKFIIYVVSCMIFNLWQL